MNVERRKTHLIRPNLQVRAIVVGALLALSVLIVQGLTMTYSIHRMALELPSEGVVILERLPSLLLTNLAISCAVLVPLVTVVGLKATHRVVGPLHRIEEHLRSLLRGEDPGPLRLRKGDELQDLARLVGEALRKPRTSSMELEQGSIKEPLPPLPASASQASSEPVHPSRED